MARRSPANARYRKDADIGSTRKSAASAKPKRAAGEVGPAAKKPKGKRERPSYDPPEAKPWRTRWWILIAIAMGAAATIFIPQVKASQNIQKVVLAIEMTALAAAIYIDAFIIRKMRKELAKDKAEAAGGKKPAKDKAE